MSELTPETIDHGEMVKTLAKSGADIISGLKPETMHLLHMAIGISGEVAELIEADNEYVVSSNHKGWVIEEIGDFEFYCQGIRNVTGSKRSVLSRFPSSGWTMHDDLTFLAGDILDYVKKAAIYEAEISMEELASKLHELESAMNCFLYNRGIDLDTCLLENKKKLFQRYSGFQYNNEGAQQRPDKDGAAA